MATIIDVAKLAGVGIGSVSRVINGKDSVSDKTKFKVNKAIKALNYKPNQSARSLVSKKFNTIGIWGTELAGTFNSQTLRVIDHELITHEKHCLVTNGDISNLENPSAAIDSVNDLIRKGCDGIIFWGTDITHFDIAFIEKYFPNIVLLNNRIEKFDQNVFILTITKQDILPVNTWLIMAIKVLLALPVTFKLKMEKKDMKDF